MARIEGVDLPREKRIEVGLTYIYGIGRPISRRILRATKVSPDTRMKDLTEAEVTALRDYIGKNFTVGGRPAPRSPDEHQAPGGDRLLPRPAPPPQPAGARAADAHQLPHAQGPEEDRGRARPPARSQEEVGSVLSPGGAAAEIRMGSFPSRGWADFEPGERPCGESVFMEIVVRDYARNNS